MRLNAAIRPVQEAADGCHRHEHQQQTSVQESILVGVVAREAHGASMRDRRQQACDSEADGCEIAAGESGDHRYTRRYNTGHTPTTKYQNTAVASNVECSSLPWRNFRHTSPSATIAPTACSACVPMMM